MNGTDRLRPRDLLQHLYPFFFMLLLWAIHVLTVPFRDVMIQFGIGPRSIQGLRGIVFSPLLHADFAHLISNSVPLLVLGTALFHFYREISWQVTGLIWLFSGLGTWLLSGLFSADEHAYVVGASGLIYGFAGFVLVSGIIRAHPRLMAISLLTIYLYGSLVWGLLPSTETHISWEGHLSGALAGITMAIMYRKKGPQRKRYSYELEEEEDDDNGEPPVVEEIVEQPVIRFRYNYRPSAGDE